MKVLVTGARGFVGRHVSAALVARGHEVVGLARAVDGMPPGVEPVACELGDEAAVRALLARCRPEGLVHLAWYTWPGRYWSAPENLADVIRGVMLLRAFHEAGGRRYVGGGTCAEYDWSLTQVLDEATTPCRPKTLYGAAKLALGLVVDNYAQSVGLSAAWLRYGFLYGADEHAERLVPSAIRTLLAGRDFACSQGTQVRDFVHVDDAARATVAVLDSDVGGMINVGSGALASVRDVIELVARAIGQGAGRPLFGARAMAADEPPVLALALHRLHDEVGWRSSVSLAAGIGAAVEALRAEGAR